MKSACVIGIGNPYRGDDAVGWIVAQQIAAQRAKKVETLTLSGEGAGLIEAWADRATVVLVDAVQAGQQPGTIYRFDAGKENVPARFFQYSSHAFSLAEAVALSQALGQLPDSLIIYGVEGEQFAQGQPLCEAVQAAVPIVVQRIWEDLAERGTPSA